MIVSNPLVYKGLIIYMYVGVEVYCFVTTFIKLP